MATDYPKRIGTGDTDGVQYEQKLAALVYVECLRSWRQGTISSFRIGVNVDGCGSFDDVVVQFSYDDGHGVKCRRLFIQAKHRKDNKKRPACKETLFSQGDKNDFGLVNYLKAFVEIKENSKRIDEMFVNESDETDYIIYTNNTYCKKANETEVIKIEDYQLPIDIIVKGDQQFKINLDHQKRDAFKTDVRAYFKKFNETRAKTKNYKEIRVDDSMTDEYLDNLKLFFNQPDVKKIEEMLTEKLSSSYKFFDADSHFDVAFKRFQQWFTDESFLLTENNDLFLEALLFDYTQDCKTKFKKFRVTFSSESLDSLSKTINANTIIHISTDGDSEFLHTMRVCQTLNKMGMKYVMCDTEIHQDIFKESPIGLSDQVQCFVINGDWEVNDLGELTIKIPNKKMIVISDRSTSLKLIGDYQAIENYEFKLTDFNEETCSALKTRKVTIQGKEVVLKSLVDNDGFNSDLLVQLIKKEPVKIGEKMTFDEKDVYVKRIFSQSASSIEKYLNDPNMRFAISGNYEERIKPDEICDELLCFLCGHAECVKRFMKLENNDEMGYSNLRKIYPSIVWIQFDFKQQSPLRILLEDDLIDSIVNTDNYLDRFVIVGADPGMGKSTFINELVDSSVTAKHFLWTVRINLNEHKHFLNDVGAIDAECVYGFILKSLNLKMSYEIDLFRHSYVNVGNVLLLFDGYDEICSTYSSEVMKLFQVLKQSKIKKIVITTRHHESENLEKEMNTAEYCLNPFSVLQTEIYIKLYVKKQSTENCKNFVNDWTKFKNVLFIDNELLNTPLNLNITIDYFRKHYKNDVSRDFDQIPSLLELYDSIADTKFNEIFCKQKGNVNNKDIQNKYKDLSLEYHKKVAIVEIFDEDAAKSLKLSSNQENPDEWFKIGFTTKKRIMVHRTFLEYFAGLALSECFMKDPQPVIELFERVNFHSDQYLVVRRFFDMKMTLTFPVHKAVLGKDEKTLLEIASKNDVNTTDAANRTPLHLAISHKNLVGFGTLIWCGARVDVADTIHGWTHEDYARRFNMDDMLHSILFLGTKEWQFVEHINLSNWIVASEEVVKLVLLKNENLLPGHIEVNKHLSMDEIAQKDLFFHTAWRMLTNDPSGLKIINDIILAAKKLTSPKALGSTFENAIFCHERIPDDLLLDENFKFAISGWTEEIFEKLVPQETILNLKTTEIDDKTDLESFRFFLLNDADPEIQFHRINELIHTKDLIWVKSNELKFIDTSAKPLPMNLIKKPQSLNEIMNDEEKICIIDYGDDVKLCKNAIDLPMVIWKIGQVNEESVQCSILNSLFLKHGLDIKKFHKYFKDGRTMLEFYNISDIELQNTLQILRDNKAYKFCIKTKSSIFLYYMTIIPIGNEIEFSMKLVEFRKMFNKYDEIQLKQHFNTHKLKLAIELNQNEDAVSILAILIDCLNVNTSIEIKLTENDQFDLNNEFMIIEVDWNRVAFKEDVYQSLHDIFLEQYRMKCTNLLNDNNTLQLSGFSMDYIDHFFGITVRLVKILQTKVRKIIMISNKPHELASYLDTVVHSVHFNQLVDFRKNRSSDFAPIFKILTQVFERDELPRKWDCNLKTLLFEKLLNFLCELFEKYETIPFGTKSVILLAPVLWRLYLH